MGSETEYERGLRSKTWGKSRRGVADVLPVIDIVSLVENSLCADLRQGKLSIQGLHRAALEFSHAYRMLADSSRLLFHFDGTSEGDILNHYNGMTTKLLRETSSDPYVEHFIEIARHELISLCRSDRPFLPSADQPTRLVLRKFLSQYVDTNLCAAYDVSTEVRRQGRAEVASRREAINCALSLDHVIENILACNLKIRTPRRNRPNAKQFAKTSLLDVEMRENIYASAL